MSFEEDYQFEHPNGKDYTVRIRRSHDHDSDKECDCCKLTTRNGTSGILVEIVEMYDENYVDISAKSKLYRNAKRFYNADGKWHYMCEKCRKQHAKLYGDDEYYDFFEM